MKFNLHRRRERDIIKHRVSDRDETAETVEAIEGASEGTA